MSSIKIKNFGPIKEGFADNNGFLAINKAMIFIGNQGSGKSSIVKLISTLTWLEKSLVKKHITIDDVKENDAFKTKWCEYQSIHNYFKPDTYIEYDGKYVHFKYDANLVKIQFKEVDSYEIPKITYIPAERNFLSVLEELENVKGLPKSLSWTLEEYLKGSRNHISPVPIHINDIKFEYNKENKTAYISGEDFNNLKLSEASSGIQSVTPMMVVSYYLRHFIDNPKLNNLENASFAERKAYEELEQKISKDKKLTPHKKKTLLDNLYKRFLPQYLFTIIEEIEQNLFPESQKNILFNTFYFVNEKASNHLIITTHSPYIIAYTTLAMKAYIVCEKAKNNNDLINKINSVVPFNYHLNPNEVGIYQIDNNGKVVSIKSERGLISDNNYLNNSLEETNDLFNELLDIEEECKK